MYAKISTLALAAVLAGAALTGCGGSTGADSPSNAQVTAAVRNSTHEAEPGARMDDDHERDQAVSRFLTLLNDLRQVPQLAPLFDQYQVPNPIVVEDDEMSAGLIQLLRAVRITVDDGTVRISNRATGGVIYSAPRDDLASGTFHPENLPGGTTPSPTTCSSFTYSAWSACQNGMQTRTVLTSSPAGCTGGSPVILQACTSTPPPPATCTSFTYSAWGACTNGTQTRTVLTSSPAGCTGGNPVTSQACTSTPPPPATCTSFTYSAWGACQPNGTQTRTVLSSSPAGCTGGTPATSQACTYTAPLDGAALYGTYCSRCHGALASSNLKGRNMSLSTTKSFNMTQGLTDAQLQAIVTAVGP